MRYFPTIPALLLAATTFSVALRAADLVPSGAGKEEAKAGADAWLFAYFRQRYPTRVEVDAEGHTHEVPLPAPMLVDELHFALSDDGRHWTPLHGNRPVWNEPLRDPFLQRGPDGLWRLVATGGRSVRLPDGSSAGPTCLTAVSPDLVTWEDVRSLPLMAGVRDEAGRSPRNIWAPEWFLDRQTGETIVLWASSFEDAGWKRSRLWFARTRDWKTFTPAKVLFAPSYSAIDGTLIEHDGTYFLFHKEEEFAVATGERRAIRVATADRVGGPYRVLDGPLNKGQISPTIAEGPSVMPDPKGRGWLLFYDYCMDDRYGVSSSSDLIHWTIEKAADFPPDARHGCFVRITTAEAARLREVFGKTEEPRKPAGQD